MQEIGGVGRGFLAVVASGTQDDLAGVVQFCGDHVGGDGDTGCFVIGPAVLFAAQEDVAGGEAIGGDEKFAVGIVERQADIGFGACGHERGRGGDIPTEAGDAVEVVQRHAEFGFTLVANLHGGTVLAQVSTF